MSRHRYAAAALAAMMVLSVVAFPGAVAADEDEDGLEIDVTQDDGIVTVTVTDNDSAAENATVNATLADEDDDWVEADETDEDGEFSFDAPDASDLDGESVNITFKASYDGATDTEQKEIEAVGDEDEADENDTEETDLAIDVSQDDGVTVSVTDNDSALENATVNVTVGENASYAGTGDHVTDEDGTVSLPVPTETVDATFEATYGSQSVETTVTLQETDTFGQAVSMFVATLDPSETQGGIGSQVSAFVTENNPGNAPDHAGPPDHAGNGTDGDQGPPAHAGGNDEGDDNGGESDGQGPPSNANSSDD